MQVKEHVCYNQTSLSGKLDATDGKAAYDENAKWLLAEKEILAHILVYAIPEYQGMQVEEVILLIEEQPLVAGTSMEPGKTNISSIIGDNVENVIPGEGSITYDIRFHAWLPGKQERIKLLIDVEAQRNFYPGYDIVTRGVFYTARMISAQLGTEFDNSHYDNIKKVYSIWICMNVPKYAENTITEFSMRQKNLVGDFPIGKSRYDLQSVIMIGLAKELSEDKDSSNKLHRLLGTVLSKKLSVHEKRLILENEYNIPMTQSTDGRGKVMCNLSEAIEKEGILKTLFPIVRKMLKKGMSVAEMAEWSEQEEQELQQMCDLILENPTASDSELVDKYMCECVW